VPGGTFFRTYAFDADGGLIDEANRAEVSTFRLDKYLVTVGRIRQYVNYITGITGAPPANGSGIHTHVNGGLGLANSWSPGTYETGWDAENWNAYIVTGIFAADVWQENMNSYGGSSWTDTPGTQEKLPINSVNWYEAYAFCIWDGGFLPSEAEWLYAAAGGSLQREYPWGSTAPGTTNLYAIYGCNYPPPGDPQTCRLPAPVGTATLGVSVWGQLDMLGDADEWLLDWYAGYVDPCTDCAALLPTTGRVLRGGTYYEDALDLTERSYGSPPYGSYIGFRCARAP
jgi:formylglycine-generating enzyme required for sulfatase activity